MGQAWLVQQNISQKTLRIEKIIIVLALVYFKKYEIC